MRFGLLYPELFGKVLTYAPAIQFYEESPDEALRSGNVAGEARIFLDDYENKNEIESQSTVVTRAARA